MTKKPVLDQSTPADGRSVLRIERDKLSGMMYEILRQLQMLDAAEDFVFDLSSILAKVPGAAKWWAEKRKEMAAWEKQQAADKAAAIAAVKADIEAAQAKLDKLMGIERPQVRRKPIVNYPMFKAGDAVWYYAKVNGPGVRGKVVRKVKMKGKPPHDWGYSIDSVGGKRLTDKATVTQLTSRTGNGLVDRDA